MLEPAKAVGGDFYDFLLFDDEELYFIIGDVSGRACQRRCSWLSR